ncbi:T9SS type A sorting domain-containing protein [Sunxiuqinia elliptica]|uniref:Por secretion system C-terminal sorting domain-containing protein n=1 Tax=Sunxiuqinia elliptica TaxID=655355 RepID=A0A1I2CQ20_9BACT|nr:T9SS type A sorting domain-containing protein [Sunxiuqinia elliptica]SFE69850.1 Por secretion system C-terminal sorting domain-containing protein [Sunxiuqinia elliptica]
MKKRNLFLILAIVLCRYSVTAQSDAATYFAKYITAMKFYEGKELPVNHEKAFQLMKECADEGQMDEAMLKLGVMYKLGLGTQKSDKEAFRWVCKSSRNGNPDSHYLLGVLYKNGLGTQQNFIEAKKAFKKSADLGNAKGKYMLGYMYYRGLGGEQSYKKAVELFNEAEMIGSPIASYMLGVSYKNGYGVKKNQSKSALFLDKAIERGYRHAIKEKRNGRSEVNLKRDQEYKKNITSNLFLEKPIKQENLGNRISGEWQGKQYTFDWSREHILEEVDLKMVIKEENGFFSGEWYENSVLLLSFSGKIIDKVMVFDQARFKALTRRGEQVEMLFTKAKLEMLSANNKYLAGEIESYVPGLKEPGYPMYIIAERVEKLKQQEPDTLVNKTAKVEPEEVVLPAEELAEALEIEQNPSKNGQNGQEQDAMIGFIKEKDAMFKVYPNPAGQSVTIDYELDEKVPAVLSVYNTNGVVVMTKNWTESHKGHNTHQIDFGFTPGTYIVVLNVNGQSFSKIVIKK